MDSLTTVMMRENRSWEALLQPYTCYHMIGPLGPNSPYQPGIYSFLKFPSIQRRINMSFFSIFLPFLLPLPEHLSRSLFLKILSTIRLRCASPSIHSIAEGVWMEEEIGNYTPSTWAATAFICSIIIIAISFYAKRLLGYLRKQGDAIRSLSNKKKASVVFILGGPGSGKGTQSANIIKQFGYTHLCPGDLLRNEIASGSKNGTIIQKIMNEGRIVPSDITVELLLKAMQESENNKFLVDGFPRNEENRAAFESKTGIIPEFVFFLDCSEKEMQKRLLCRKQGREDDNIQTILERFKVFKECTLPVIEYYSTIGKVHKIDSGKPTEDVFNDIKRVFFLYGIKAT